MIDFDGRAFPVACPEFRRRPLKQQPSSAEDADMRCQPAIAKRLLADHIRQLSANGAAVLVVEQRAKAVLEISNYTYARVGGRLRMSGSPSPLATSSSTPFCVAGQ